MTDEDRTNETNHTADDGELDEPCPFCHGEICGVFTREQLREFREPTEDPSE